MRLSQKLIFGCVVFSQVLCLAKSLLAPFGFRRSAVFQTLLEHRLEQPTWGMFSDNSAYLRSSPTKLRAEIRAESGEVFNWVFPEDLSARELYSFEVDNYVNFFEATLAGHGELQSSVCLQLVKRYSNFKSYASNVNFEITEKSVVPWQQFVDQKKPAEQTHFVKRILECSPG